MSPLPGGMALHGDGNDDGDDDPHADLQLFALDVYGAGGSQGDDPDSNRALFVSAEGSISVAVKVRNRPGSLEAANNFSVAVLARHQNGDLYAPISTCTYRITDPLAVGDWMNFTVAFHDLAVESPQKLTIEAHVNNEQTHKPEGEGGCDYTPWNEMDATPSGDLSDYAKADNFLSRTIMVGEMPDLTNRTSEGVVWCQTPFTSGDCANEVPPNNVTHYPGNPEQATYFWVYVENVGDYTQTHNGGVKNPETGNSAVPFYVNYTLRHRETGETTFLTPGEKTSLGWVNSTKWNLTGKAGPYRLTVRIDSTNYIRERSEDNNTLTFDFRVESLDLRTEVNRSNLKTTPADPYLYKDSSYQVRFNTTVFNDDSQGTGSIDWKWRGVLDPGTSREKQLWNESFPVALGGDENHTVENTFSVCSDPVTQAACYKTPGKHVLRVIADSGHDLLDSNRLNNVDDAVFWVEDNTPPAVDAEDFGINKTNVRNGEAVEFEADVREADLYLRDVVVRVESPDGAVREIPMEWQSRIGDVHQFLAEVPDGFTQRGTHNYTVVATDPTGHVTESPMKTFEVTPWAKNIDILYPPPGRSFEYDPGNMQEFDIEVIINETGVTPVWNTSGKIIIFEYPPQDGRVIPMELGSAYVNAGCDDENQIRSDEAEQACEEMKDLFEIGMSAYDIPGRWNITIEVTDAAGDKANATTYFIVQDALPVISNEEVTSTVDAGEPVEVRANLSDDFNITHALVNFTHEAGHEAQENLTLVNGTIQEGNYSATVTTGALGKLKWAGSYNWTIAVRDENFNWREVSGALQVNDTEDPSVAISDVVPRSREVDRNFTFYAVVNDDTAVNVSVRVIRGGTEEQIYPMEDPDGDRNFTLTRKFTRAGAYTYQFLVEDSAGKANSTASRQFQVVGNLPPEVRVEEPTVSHNATVFYATAEPLIVARITDVNDVDLESVRLTVDGVQVDVQDNLTRLASGDGYVLTYEPLGPYSDGDAIDVRLQATDLSARNKTRHFNFTLWVDTTAPVTPEPAFSPRHPTSAAIVWNVSRNTLFTLESTDGGLRPSGVAAIKYRLVSDDPQNTPGTTQTYEEAFRITDDIDGYAGAGLYRLYYWAEDRLGHAESQNVLRLRVDTQGPDIGFYPNQRYVNATVVDPEGVAVAEVTLHHRRQGEVDYSTTEMALSDGRYRAMLPEVGRTVSLEYYIRAEDALGNVDTRGTPENPFRYDPLNSVPVVTLLEPSASDTLTGVTRVEWSVDERDGDPVEFTLQYKLARDPDTQYTSLVERTGQRIFQWDTAQVADGTYDIRVIASDGQGGLGEDAIRVRVENAKDAATPYRATKDRVALGGEAILKARINKVATNVTAAIYRDGAFYDAVTMYDDGTNGDALPDDLTYSARYQFVESGRYTWRVNVTYEGDDGALTTSQTEAPGEVTVFLTSGDIVAANLGLWMAVVVLTLAAGALGGYALLNRFRREGL